MLQQHTTVHDLTGVCMFTSLHGLQADIAATLDRTNAHPVLIRLAWHDAGTYDKDTGVENWPKCGGANG